MISIPSLVGAPAGVSLAVAPNLARASTAAGGSGGVTPTPTPTQIGGLAIGAEGVDYAAGYFLASGKDYSDGQLELITPANPRGRFAASRGTYLIAAPGQSPKGSDGLAGYDAVPGETGWNDANRGVPVASFGDMITIVGGRLRLRQRPLVAGEAALIDKARPVLGSMIHTALAFTFQGAGIWQWREQRSAYARSHMTTWIINNFFSVDLIELDIESSNKADGTGNGVQLGFNSNDWNNGVQTAVEISAPQNPSQATEHEYAFKVFPNGDVQAFMDGVSLGIATGYRAKVLLRSFHLLITNHAYAAGVTSNDPVADYFTAWVRVYRHQTGTKYAPRVQGGTYNVDFNTPFSLTLPSQLETWGVSGKTEVIRAFMVEPNEPGGATSGQVYSTFPAGVALNQLTISGAVADKSGRLHVIREIQEAGSVCEPQHIIINVGPNIRVGDLNFPAGVPVNFDLYALCDCGVLVTDGTSRTKVIEFSTTGNSGLSFSNATGMITGTPPADYSGQYILRVTNSLGQVATRTSNITTRAAYDYESWDGVYLFDASDQTTVPTSGSAATGWKNKRVGNGDLTALGLSGWTYVPATVNGLPVIRLQKNANAIKSNMPRMSASGSNVPISQIVQGDDKPYMTVDVFVSRDALTHFVRGWSKSTGTSTDAETIALIRRATAVSTNRRANVTATTNDAPIRGDNAGTPANSVRIVVTRFNGTTVDTWDTTITGKVTAAQDALPFTTGMVFRLGATEAPDGSGGGNFALTQGNTDYCELMCTSPKTDAQVVQCINDLAAKWGATLS